MSKMVSITDFLNEKQIKQASRMSGAKEICDKIIKPNIDSINKKLGQENDPMYLAYMVEYVLRYLMKK